METGVSSRSIWSHPLTAVFATTLIALAGFVINDLATRSTDRQTIADLKKETSNLESQLERLDQYGTQAAQVTNTKLEDALRRIAITEKTLSENLDKRLLETRYDDAVRRIAALERRVERMIDRVTRLESKSLDEERNRGDRDRR